MRSLLLPAPPERGDAAADIGRADVMLRGVIGCERGLCPPLGVVGADGEM